MLTKEEISQVALAVIEAMAAATAAVETPVAVSTPADVERDRAEAAAVVAAAAEKARWDAMSPEELAIHERAAAKTRYVQGVVNALRIGQDPGVVLDHEEGLDATTIKECRAEAHRQLADNPTAQAAIESGLKSRKTQTVELLQAVTEGKASAEQQAQLAELLVGR